MLTNSQDAVALFKRENEANVAAMSADPEFQNLSKQWLVRSAKHKYSYQFRWMGRPIIQLPQDIVALQEIIWETKPDLIIEAGIAHGGSLIFYASMLELLGGNRSVIGVDVEIRPHNRVEIEKHPMSKRITMIEGSSVDSKIVDQVRNLARGKKSIMVALDSNHTHDHVLEELRLYSPLVTKGNYLVVLDTLVEDLPDDAFPNRPWGKGNNPKTAVREFLKTTDRFVMDHTIEKKLLLTVAPDGYLKCVR